MWQLTPVAPALLDDEAEGSQTIESSLQCTAGPGLHGRQDSNSQKKKSNNETNRYKTEWEWKQEI